MSKLREALEELVVKTANAYGGFEGFEPDDQDTMQRSENKILAWVAEVIGKDEPNTVAGSLEWINMARNELRAELRKRAGL